MKLYIWYGNGISEAYHDDGTLVVLAESPEQAREVVCQEKVAHAAYDTEHAPARKAQYESERRRMSAAGVAHYGGNFWLTDLGKTIAAEREAAEASDPYFSGWDGSTDALAREPDRVVELDKPAVVAFNGGGYD